MKNLIALFTISILFTISTTAQTVALSNHSTPTFTGSKDNSSTQELEITRFRKVEKEVIAQLQNDIKFPALAYEYGIEGTVLVQFIFDGEIKEAKITKSLGVGCDKTALKAIENFPKLYRELGGKNLESIQVTIPFRFEL